MSYRCKLCGDAIPPGKPRLVLTRYRPDGQIASETPVCSDCHAGRPTEQPSEEPADLFGSLLPATKSRVNGRGATVVSEVNVKAVTPPTAPRCDLCGTKRLDGGQVTADTVLCRSCIQRVKGGV